MVSRYQDIAGIFDSSRVLERGFVELLKYLKADRQIAPNGHLLWKCDLCGLETTGMGIHSHRSKHCSEYGHFIDRENEIRRKPFVERIEPYQEAIHRVIRATRRGSKIELTNYGQSERVFELLKRENIPRELWLYVGERLRGGFSHGAFARFMKEIIHQLQGIEPLRELPMIWKTYENILRYVPEDLRINAHAV
jgi:hypothetical protein